jgi:uncharacterized membrane protein YfcA
VVESLSLIRRRSQLLFDRLIDDASPGSPDSGQVERMEFRRRTGGELIIPALVLLFAVPIKAAGTLSLLISIPTILVGLARHHARGTFEGLPDLRHLVVPMALGTSLGGIVGGAMVVFVPTGAVKLLLGSVLIASAAKVFAVDRRNP